MGVIPNRVHIKECPIRTKKTKHTTKKTKIINRANPSKILKISR